MSKDKPLSRMSLFGVLLMVSCLGFLVLVSVSSVSHYFFDYVGDAVYYGTNNTLKDWFVVVCFVWVFLGAYLTYRGMD